MSRKTVRRKTRDYEVHDHCEQAVFMNREQGKQQEPQYDPRGATHAWELAHEAQDEINKAYRAHLTATPHAGLLPIDATQRKAIPIATGVLDYFPSALLAVADVSKAGNDQHNAGEPLHWARGKSMNQADTMLRHFLERGTLDSDGLRHSAKMAWRALALLQLELEAAGAPIARNAR